MYFCEDFYIITMKRRFLLLSLLGIVANLVFADRIGPSQALKIASSFLQEEAVPSHAAPFRRGTTRMVAEVDTLAPLYIISRGEDAGFVIVSGDNCLPEIIGYTDSGNFVEADMPPALLDMLRGYARIIEEAQAEGVPARAQQKAAEDRVAIKPLIEAHWHQTAPYNNLAPFLTGTTNRAVTGCTCTAAVMVLHYFRRDLPHELLAATPTYGYGDAPVTVSYPKGTPIQWDLMLNSYNTSYPEEMGNAVAVLNAAFGAGIWQTYGSSTSGQIANIVDGYNSYFNMSATCQYQGGTSQTSWENTIYRNLKNKQPMVYAGVHESQGGHAIILDGYNPKGNLFHFNFGWGGQGDGYYTLDAQTGINGFAGQQGMVYNIAPKAPKITGKMQVPKQAFRRTETPIRINVTNNGTLDYSGFNIYWSTNNRKPTSSTSVSANNTDLILSTDESGEFTVMFKPTLEKKYYLYLTDKRYNVLDQAEIDILSADADMTLNSFDISASSQTEEHKSGTYRMLYNNELTAKAVLTNSSKGTAVQPGFRLRLMSYNEETESLEQVRNITANDNLFAPGETKEIEVRINRLVAGTYYTLVVNRELTNVDNGEQLNLATSDTLIRFKACAPTLDSLYVKDGVMMLAGDWDPKCFSDLAADPSVVGYDLTQVSGVNTQPVAANPNALFYTATKVKGYNIVYQNQIEELHLQQGYAFRPSAEYKAAKVVFTPYWEIGQWNTLSLPFTAVVPDGYICRYPTEFVQTTLRTVELSDTLYAGTPYLMMIADEDVEPIIARDVTIDMNAVSVGIPEFSAVLSNTIAADSVLVLNVDPAEELQYFELVDSGTVLQVFTGVFKGKKRLRATINSTTEQAYKTLAQAIHSAVLAYDEWHLDIEPEWNTKLQDSIAVVRGIFEEMTLTSLNQIKNTANDLLAFVEIYKLQLIDKSKPIGYTGYIVNPSFENGKKDGWNSESNAVVRSRTNLATFGAGMDGNYLLYNESAEGSTTISQTIEGLPQGFYRLTAMVGTNAEGVVTLFANDSTTMVEPHAWGRFYLTEGMVDSVWVEDGVLTIGVEAGSSWYKADDFNIYYLGTGVDTSIDLEEVDVKPVTIGRKGIYDLWGRRLADRSEMLPGHIYIVDGRKTIAK